MTRSTLDPGSCELPNPEVPVPPLSASEAASDAAQLAQQIEVLRLVVDTTDDWVCVKDTQFRFVWVNQSLAQALGLTPADMLGKTDQDLGLSGVAVFGNQAQGVRGLRADDREVLAGQHIHHPYDVVMRADGQLIFDTHKKPLRNSQGNIIGIVSTAKNVTASDQAERQLAESRNMLQQVLDSFPQHVFWKNRESVFLGCNQRFAEVAGLTQPGDIVGKTDFDLPWTQAEAEHYRADDRRVMDAGIAEMGIEEPQQQVDGKQAWLETNKIPLRDKTHQVIGILGSFQVITERKHAEMALRSSQQRLNLLIEQTPLAIIEWDAQGCVRQWNRAAQQTFGYGKAEALGQFMEFIVPPEYQNQVQHIFAALLAQKGGNRSVNNNITKAGKTIICEWYNAPLADTDGQVVGVVSMAADITERKRDESIIQAQNRLDAFRADINVALVRASRLQETLQYCTEAIVQYLDAAFARIWTVSPDGTALWLQASAGIYTHLDGDHGQVPVGKFKIGLIALEKQPHLTNDVLSDPRVSDKAWAQREGMVAFAGYPILLGEELLGVVALFSRQPLSPEVLTYLDSAVGEIALGIKRDQTEVALRQSEASLRQRTEELEHLMQDLQQAQLQMVQNEKMSALGNLVAGVAHEINNPVGFLKGNIKPAQEYINDLFRLLELYQTAMPQPSEEIEAELEAIDLDFLKVDLPKLLGSMTLGVDRIKNISNSLRTFSRADQDHKTSFDLHAGLDSTLLILKHRLKARDAHPEIEVVRHYGNIPPIECFAGQLNQVFMNLLANAIDALEEENEARSKNKSCHEEESPSKLNQIVVTTALSDDEQYVHVIIRDNGTGMPEDVKNRIFDHLFTTKAVGKGTGLGLAIAHQIVVDNHGGHISVESQPSKGTAFKLMLPILAA